MSKFKISIPVDVDAIVRGLPAGTYIHGIRWASEASTVDVVAEHDAFKTGRDYPVEAQLADVQKAASEAGAGAGTPVRTEVQKPVAPRGRRR
jgi:hypothetical protein